MATKIVFKIIKPKLYDLSKLEKQVDKALKSEAEIISRSFGQVTKTWSNPAKFTKKKIFVFNGRGIRVFTKDKKMLWLNFGTKVRWAIMSKGFKSKTRHRVIGSRSGSGKVLRRGKRQMQSPKPGIKAREFDKEIAKRRQPLFAKKVKKAISKGIKR